MNLYKMYQVIEGPIHTSDIEDSYYDEKDGWIVVGLVEQVNGSILEEEVLFDTFDEAYEVVKWFKQQIIPFEFWDED